MTNDNWWYVLITDDGDGDDDNKAIIVQRDHISNMQQAHTIDSNVGGQHNGQSSQPVWSLLCVVIVLSGHCGQWSRCCCVSSDKLWECCVEVLQADMKMTELRTFFRQRRPTHCHDCKPTDRQTDIDIHTDRQIDIHTDRQIDRQTQTQRWPTHCHDCKPTDRQTDTVQHYLH